MRILTGPGREIPRGADVVIVGSGPSGAAYARVLSEQRPDLHLLTFETGPLVTSPPGAHVKGIDDDDARAEAQRRSEGPHPQEATGAARPGRGVLRRAGTFLVTDPAANGPMPALAMSSNVGGMAAHWTAACPRPGGREVVPFVENLSSLLDEAERLLGVTSSALADAPFAATVRSRLSSIFDADRVPDRRVQPMPLAIREVAHGKVIWAGSDVVYGRATDQNPRHVLVPEALVTRLLHGDEGVEGVRVRDLATGTEHDVRAREVVVAADALRTPQLLWASGIRPAALGRYLNDQPQLIHATRLRDVASSAAGADRSVRAGQGGVSWVPYTDEQPFHGQVMQLDASPVPIADPEPVVPGTVVGLGWFCAKHVRSEDRVVFDDGQQDVFGMPAMNLEYDLTEEDRRRIEVATGILRTTAKEVGEPLGDAPILLPAGASLHYQGTVRMGADDDGRSVCDPRSRVWGVAGLRVAGNGVIPTSTACNPTLTSLAFAVAGARDIAKTLTSGNGGPR